MGAIVVIVTGLVLVGLAAVARVVRRRGSAGAAISAAMAAYDEAMHSTANDTFVEVQAQKDRGIAVQSRGKKRR